VAAAGLTLVAAATAIAAQGDTTLVSRQSAAAGGAGADDDSQSASASRTGRFTAFATKADNLGGPARDVSNVYVHDAEKRTVRLVSRQSESAGGAGANGASVDPSISASGRFVAFETEASNLGGPARTGRQCQPDSRPCSNIYVYDLEKKRVQLVSRQGERDGGRGADANSINPAISADGLSVAFETFAGNLGGPVHGFNNVYVHDRDKHRTALVSRQSEDDGGDGGSPGGAGTPSISGDGRFVAFWTNDDNLGGPKTAFNAIYVYDRGKNEVTLVSRQSAADGGAGAARSAYDPSISSDGRFVAFFTYATNLGGPVQTPGSIYVYDLRQEEVRLASRQAAADGGDGANSISESPSISADGRRVAFDTQATTLGGSIVANRNVYVYDIGQQSLELASRQSASAGGEAADGNSRRSSLSGSGGQVAFVTDARNLGGPARPVANIYRHDLGN
jgi:Tol biopolymer transport system component